jgi:putative glutamine amidotransferase
VSARPAIGLCAAIERASWGAWDEEAALLPRSYARAVQRAGGLALMLPPDPLVVDDPDELLDRLDGLVLTGGCDIDPATYGAEPHAQTGGTSPERDEFELALARAALLRDMPLLGVCRGMQSSTCPTWSVTRNIATRPGPSPITTCASSRARWPRGWWAASASR